MSTLEVDKLIPQSGTSVQIGENGDTITIPAGATFDASAGTITLADGSVTTAKIADGAVSLVKLSATGTKDNTTFLRGDNTFQVVNTDLVSDTSPQLGGNLDGNGNTIDLSANNTEFRLPRGTTAQQPTPSAANEGAIRYDTDDSVLYYSDGVSWKKISTAVVEFDSLSGNIYAGAQSTLTLTGSGFGTSITVNFTQSSDGIDEDVSVTPASDTSATVTVPSAVYNNVTAGNVVTVTITNSDGSAASKTTTALALPTGGTITSAGGYRYHTFNSSSSLVVPSGFTATADYLVVAGGGGGGKLDGGGGGAGGYRASTYSLSANTYTVTIGAAGTGSTTQGVRGTNGGNSVFDTITSTGGGGGGSHTGTETGASGGSGGGASHNNSSVSGGAGTAGQGFAGGAGYAGGGGVNAGGGGGGAAETGNTDGRSEGGDGLDWQSLGTYYAGGGGGGQEQSGGYSGGDGGLGGGGHGSSNNAGSNGTAGTANTGGGGGGGGYDSGSGGNGFAGGSGIVIIRYAI